jgi:hypothetical protein
MIYPEDIEIVKPDLMARRMHFEYSIEDQSETAKYL